MRIAAGVFVFFVLSFQICNAQQYSIYGWYDPFYFYHEPSTSAGSSGKIYLNNYDDAYSSLYNPAIPSSLNSIRFSYSKSQKTFDDYFFQNNVYYDSYGIDIPIKNIGTFSLVKRYFHSENSSTQMAIFYGGERYTSYNFNFSREICRGLSAGIGFNYFKSEFWDGRIDNTYNEYYSLNIGASYKYNLPEFENYTHQAIANISVMNIPTSNPKARKEILPGGGTYIIEPPDPLPQIDHISLGYMSKYQGMGIIRGFDDFQGDIQIEYSDLLNSRYYNTISLGMEIKFLEIVSIRGGYYNYKDYYYNTPLDKITYGFGLTFPLKLVMDIPLELGIDYSHLKDPYFSFKGKDYFDSFSLNVRYSMY
jgi:hypothetical protein